MSKVQAFPFDSLPQYTEDQASLKHRLLSTYYFFQNQKHVFEMLSEPFAEIIGTKLKTRIAHVDLIDLSKFVLSCSEHALIGTLHMEPHGKKALVVFETLLAKVLVHQMLSGKTMSVDHLAQLQIKPLTALEEGVVEYVMVAALDKIYERLKNQGFSVTYDNILREPKKLMGLFANHDEFAVYTIELSLFERNFFVKLLLPLTVADDLVALDQEQYFLDRRLKNFGKFNADFQIEVGDLNLSSDEIDSLDEGDIFLLDNCDIELKKSGIKGMARMTLDQDDNDHGYEVELEGQAKSVRVTVDSVY